MQLEPVVLAQAPVQAYEVAAGLHVAVSVDVPPDAIVAGDALKLQLGTVGAVTVTLANASEDGPDALLPTTENVVVTVGLTVQLEPAVLAQAPVQA